MAGQAVQLADKEGKNLDALSLEEFRSLDPIFDKDVFLVFDPQRSVARRNAIGGTAPQAVRAQLKKAKKYYRMLEQISYTANNNQYKEIDHERCNLPGMWS